VTKCTKPYSHYNHRAAAELLHNSMEKKERVFFGKNRCFVSMRETDLENDIKAEMVVLGPSLLGYLGNTFLQF
jgi:hypothetical protein